MEDKTDEQTTKKPPNKKLMYGAVALAVVVLGYVYYKNKSAAASTTSSLVSGGAIDPLTGNPYQPGVGSLAQSTGAGIQGLGVPLIIKNIIHTSGGTGSKSGTTTTLPTTSTPQYPTGLTTTTSPPIITPAPAPTPFITPAHEPPPATIRTPAAVSHAVNPVQAQNNAQALSYQNQLRRYGL